MDLEDQVALVTGGSRGLGRGFAQGLAAAGARVVLTGRSEERVSAAAAELSINADQVVGMAADVTDVDDAVRIVTQVEQDIGPLSLLVNNAGMLRAAGPVGVVDPSLWWREIEVNLRGPFLYSAAVLPAMRARRAGRIINVASDSGLGPVPAESAYNVSKTAVIRLSEVMAAETASDGIAVFAFHPGYVRTDMTDFIDECTRSRRASPGGAAVLSRSLRGVRGHPDRRRGRHAAQDCCGRSRRPFRVLHLRRR